MDERQLSDSEIARYLAGQCSPAEWRRVRDILASSKVDAAALRAAECIWDLGEHAQGYLTDSDVWRRIQQDIRPRTPVSANDPGANRSAQWVGNAQTRARNAFLRQVLPRIRHELRQRPSLRSLRSSFEWLRVPTTRRVLAPLGIACATGIVIWVGREYLGADGRNAIAQRAYSTSTGQRSRIFLPDSSAVDLAPDSRLTYSDSSGSRRVSLEGEAYFQVAHSARHAFIVLARNAITRDLATHFVVRAYPDDPDVRVAVMEGSVELQSTTHAAKTTLTDGTLAIVNAAGEASLGSPSDLDGLLGWRTGRLVLRRVPLGRAVHEVGRWYGIDVYVADSADAAIPVSGSLPATSADEALKALAAVGGVQVTRNGNQIILGRSSRIRVRGPGAAAR